jgi:hypothetical protein
MLNKDVPYYQQDKRHEVAPADDNVVKTDQVKAEFLIFFRYTRMNEIIVSITYFHKKNSFFNSKDLKFKSPPSSGMASSSTSKGSLRSTT